MRVQKNSGFSLWKLHDQIKRDARKPGVILELEKQEAAWDLARLIKDRAIKKSDLEGFSPEMIEIVEKLLQRN